MEEKEKENQILTLETNRHIKEESEIDNRDKKEENNDAKNETEKKEEAKDEEKNKSKGCHFPTSYTVLIVIEIIAFILTYIIQKGKYDTIEYVDDSFLITSYGEDDRTVEATQEVLDEFKIKIPLDNFVKGYIKKPISIPGTYKKIEGETQNFLNLFLFPIKGLIEAADISFFIMIFGGNMAILDEMKALSSGISTLGRYMKGKEFLLLCICFVLISIGGSTFGLQEEIIGFYPVLMPLFLQSGIDGMLSTGGLFMGTIVGYMFSTVNPFCVAIGSYSAGIVFTDQIVFRIIALIIGDILIMSYLFFYYWRVKKDETKSCVYEIKEQLKKKYLSDNKDYNNNKEISNVQNEEKKEVKEKDEKKEAKNKKEEDKKDEVKEKNTKDEKENKENKFTWIQKISLIILVLGFVFLVVGVLVWDWWFEEMTGLYFVIAITLMFLSCLGEEKAIEVFTRGTGNFCGVALVIGIARGINLTLTEGNISDTILYSLSNSLGSLPKVIFAIIMIFIFIFLGIFVQSSSGLAVLSMPILAPIADQVGCSRAVVVNAFMFGQNLITMVAPTGMVLIVLQLIGIKFNYWTKFMWPMMVILFVYIIILIIINTFM